MKRVRSEQRKAVAMGVIALAALVVCVAARTFDAAWAVLAFSALAWYFVVRSRVFARAAARGCGAASTGGGRNTAATRRH